MAKAKPETAFETIRDALKNNADLAAFMTANTGKWITFEHVHKDHPFGFAEYAEGRVNFAQLPCIIMRIAEFEMDFDFNVATGHPFPIHIDMRTADQDQLKALRFLCYVLQAIATNADSNWGLSSMGAEKTLIENGPSVGYMARNADDTAAIYQIEFDLVVHLRINPFAGNGIFE